MSRIVLGVLALLLLTGASAPKHNAGGLTGEWVGSYACGASETKLKLAMAGLPMGTVAGSFVFGDPAKPTGAFRVRGAYDPAANELALRGTEWQDYPREGQWATVDLVGEVDWDRGVFSGKVVGKDCTTFSVTKAPG